jgi:predicted deacylase
MVVTVASADLPVGEALMIQKNRIRPKGANRKSPRLCVVTGTHGDELEGQYVAWRLSSELEKNIGDLRGIVDIYPALNPLGINTMCRGIPAEDVDLNRIFPGDPNGRLAGYFASEILRDIQGATVCIDIHASNIFIREMPQVRVSEKTAETLVPLAKHLNMPLIWVHASATVLESTLSHSLNSLGTPTLVVEMGVGMRITKEFGDSLIEGIFSLMGHLGIWAKKTRPARQPIVSSDWQVAFVNAEASGIFIPETDHLSNVEKGAALGIIANPLTGETLQKVKSPVAGLVFTAREYPVVYEGSLLARILHGTP